MVTSLSRNRISWILPVLLALLLYGVHLKSDLYGDEYSTFKVVSEGRFFGNLLSPKLCQPPLYFVVAKAFYVLTGTAWSIRIPSLLATLGTIILVAKIAAKMFDKEVALLALWLASSSPILVEFAAEGRPYAMLAFFSTAMGYQLLCFIEHEDWKSAMLLAGAATGGLLTHYIFCCHLAFAAGYYLFRRKRITKYALMAIALTIPVICLMVVGVLQNMTHSSAVTAKWHIDLKIMVNFLARIPVAVSYGFCTFRLPNMDIARNVTIQMVRQNVVLIAIMALIFLGLGWGILRLIVCKQERIGFLLSGVIVPVILAVSGIAAGLFVTKEKYLIGTVGYYIVLLAVVLWAGRKSLAGRATTVAYLALVALSILNYTVYPNEYSRRADWTGLRASLSASIRQGDVLLFYRDHKGRTFDVRQGVKVVHINANTPELSGIDEFAAQIDESCQGHIYLVNREVDRLGIDPKSKTIQTLKQRRLWKQKRFGRNLSLYVFTDARIGFQ